MKRPSSCVCCGAERTIKAHLIPRAFATEVASKKGEKHIITNASGAEYRTSPTGVYDDGILCAKWDGHIGQFEGAVYNSLKHIRDQKPAADTIFELALE